MLLILSRSLILLSPPAKTLVLSPRIPTSHRVKRNEMKQKPHETNLKMEANKYKPNILEPIFFNELFRALTSEGLTLGCEAKNGHRRSYCQSRVSFML